MKGVLKSLLLFVFFILAGLPSNVVSENMTQGAIIHLNVTGAIGPATTDYIHRALENAAENSAELVILQLDTPGGLDTAMRDIIKNMANSSVPIVVYVAPTGARAASAGTYILYASHIAAMAPGTNLGAATPVKIGGNSPFSPEKLKKEKDKDKNNKEQQEETIPSNTPKNAMEQKIINDAVAYIKGLAKLHGRNQEWAEKAVREAASLPASEALELNVIDIVAVNLTDLLKQINGREIKVLGKNRKLETSGLPLVKMDPDWRSRLLSVITNPNVAYILLLIGIYGLIFEFSNPGAIVPGTVGAISLLVALYAFQLLPINYAGMGLIILGLGLMVAEAFEPSFGVLGIGGVISFVLGSIILMDTNAPGFGIDLAVILTFTFISVLIFIFIIGLAMKARRRPVVSGLEELVGGEAIVKDDFSTKGVVTIHSESWNAVSDVPVKKDQQVRVIKVDGLTLTVKPIDSSKQE